MRERRSAAAERNPSGNRPAGTVRFRLFRDLLLLVVATAAAAVAVALWRAAVAREQVLSNRTGQAAVRAERELRGWVEPLEIHLRIVRDWGAAGILDLDDARSLNAKFIPILRQYPRVAGLMVAESTGREYSLRRSAGGAGWITRMRPSGARDVECMTTEWSAWDTPGESMTSVVDYDPRDRPWYQLATDPESFGHVAWTEPYIFHTGGRPGVTGAVGWGQEAGADDVAVAAIDVSVGEISARLHEVVAKGDARAFLVNLDGGVFVPVAGEPAAGTASAYAPLFRAPADAGPVVAAAVSAAGDLREAGNAASIAARFRVDGAAWRVGLAPMTDARRLVYVAVAAPESALAADASTPVAGLAIPVALVVALAGAGAAGLVRKYQRQLRELPRGIDWDDPQASIHALIAAGEGDSVEFKSTMRMNLKTGKPGKEIELAWLKSVVAYLNGDGGVILLGVGDDGAILGIEPDGFENEDRCRLHFRNLVKQHVGVGLSRHVRFDLLTVDGRTVCVVECERSSEPAYLRVRDRETFYIRSGPSSVELPVSQVVRYIEQRR